MKVQWAVLTLWGIAMLATFLLVNDVFTYLGPVYFMCMVGTMVAVRKAGHGTL